MKKSLEDYKEMVVKPQFNWVKIHWKGWMLNFGMYTIYRILRQ